MTDTLLSLAGYASLFGRRDMAGDVVAPGAFAASLLAQSDRSFPMLLSHNTKTPIGVWDRVIEDEAGLWVEGRVLTGHGQTAALIREGALSGLSIGYRTVRSNPERGGRRLLEIDLFEISVVAFPMLRDARITQIQPSDIIGDINEN